MIIHSVFIIKLKLIFPKLLGLIEYKKALQQDIINEIDRYLIMPGQALAYKIGQLKILELK